MSPHKLTGNRIRDRRLDRGLRQMDLAATVGISPSYLNLIEHNSRRIGGKLLLDIARALGVEPAFLTEGAEYALIDGLRAAASEIAGQDPELARAEDFLGRFPGWAALVAAQSRRIGQLEAQIGELADRLTHDAELAASLHQVISAVTAIRSTSSILVADPNLDRDWQDRFHRNIHDDSVRLADSSRALVTYLEGNAGAKGMIESPLEAVTAFLETVDHHITALETLGDIPDLNRLAAEAAERVPGIRTEAAQALLIRWLDRYRTDALAMPLTAFGPAARAAAHDPAPLSRQFGVPVVDVMRRLATLPRGQDHPAMGLAVCDGAGALLEIKRIPGFLLPRTGAGCPLWPLYQAFAQPGRGMRSVVALPGERAPHFLCHAMAAPRTQPDFDDTPALISTMLVRVADGVQDPARPVGLSCRVCPRSNCPDRREQ